MQPLARFPLDAAHVIFGYFNDYVQWDWGCIFTGEGPMFERPLRRKRNLCINGSRSWRRMRYVMDAVQIRKALDNQVIDWFLR